jgi:hypothetical protein
VIVVKSGIAVKRIAAGKYPRDNENGLGCGASVDRNRANESLTLALGGTSLGLPLYLPAMPSLDKVATNVRSLWQLFPCPPRMIVFLFALALLPGSCETTQQTHPCQRVGWQWVLNLLTP